MSAELPFTIASRLVDLATAGGVFVSSPTKELVAGSGLQSEA
jgi:class 3 adenylate cyclase